MAANNILLLIPAPEIEEDDPGIYFCIKASVHENRFFTVCVWIPLALALVKFL